jgi:low affinity Fe/Cu permease
MSSEKYAATLSPTAERHGPRCGPSVQAHFERFAERVTQWTGSLTAFFLAVTLLLVWVLCGPVFHYSETWQLVVNTGTTIVTFLMVFVIQQSQNKDSHAVHLKLDELLSSIKTADNALINIEHLDAQDLDRIARRYAHLADRRRTSVQDEEGEKAVADSTPQRLGRRRDRLANGLTGFTRQQRSGRAGKKAKGNGKVKSARVRRGERE